VNRSFYDYVTVQASNDAGRNWFDFIDGWDSNSASTWLGVYNSSTDAAGNSKAAGTSVLFKKREINMLSSGKFKTGDQLIIRFRLHADVGAHGWGWAIDNLNIQGAVAPPPPPPLILASEPLFTLLPELRVSPNPSSRFVRLQLALNSPFSSQVSASDEEVRVGIVGAAGQWVQQENVLVKGGYLDKQLDVSSLTAGVYYVQVNTNRNVYTKRIIVVR
jgi:hypothetical protein